MNEQEALGLGHTEATQDGDSEEDDLPSALEEAIERGGELNEEVIIVDDEAKEVEEPEEPINEEAVPDQGAQ